MRDGRPNPDIWGNIITCIEIGQGIYCIVGSKNKGIEMPKKTAEEILPQTVVTSAAEGKDGNVCFTDNVSNAIVTDALAEKNLITANKDNSTLDCLRQTDDPEMFTGFELPISDIELDGLEI